MGVFGFVIAVIVMSAGLLGARWLMPHVIDSVAVYSSVVLGTMGFCATIIGLLKN